jgi:hypothetical protein
MTENVPARPSPIIIADRVVLTCGKPKCPRPADVEYVHRCGMLTLFCDEHRREHERRIDPAFNLPATCKTCGGVSPWPVPWTAVPR